jgi:hypothetical protein
MEPPFDVPWLMVCVPFQWTQVGDLSVKIPPFKASLSLVLKSATPKKRYEREIHCSIRHCIPWATDGFVKLTVKYLHVKAAYCLNIWAEERDLALKLKMKVLLERDAQVYLRMRLYSFHLSFPNAGRVTLQKECLCIFSYSEVKKWKGQWKLLK